jgi:riboflavin biosynthesis pyrimidine reductase
MGGGATICAALDAGLVDAPLHLAPVVLGAGTPLFTGGAPRTLVQRTVIDRTASGADAVLNGECRPGHDM